MVPLKDQDGFNSFAIKYFRTDDKLSGTRLIRYHYTSAQAFMSILKPQKDDTAYLRFTDIRYMNDKSEQVYFVKVLLEYLNERKSEYPHTWEVVNDLLLKECSYEDYVNLKVSEIKYSHTATYDYPDSRFFVFCACESSDSLNMWNYYINSGKYQGYNIGINIYAFLKSFDTEAPNMIDPITVRYGAVLYNKKQQEKMIKEFVELLEHSFFKDLKEPYMNLINLKNYIETYSCFFKDECFKNEREYRVLIQLTPDRVSRSKEHYFNENNRKIKFDFFERNGILVPCLYVPLVKNAVNKITTAPTLEKSIAESSLKEFLEINGYQADVESSDIPVRF